MQLAGATPDVSLVFASTISFHQPQPNLVTDYIFEFGQSALLVDPFLDVASPHPGS